MPASFPSAYITLYQSFHHGLLDAEDELLDEFPVEFEEFAEFEED